MEQRVGIGIAIGPLLNPVFGTSCALTHGEWIESERIMDTSEATAVHATGRDIPAVGFPYRLRIVSAVLVGVGLLGMAHASKADTVSETTAATAAECRRTTDALVTAAHPSAKSVRRFDLSADASATSIRVADGEVRIVCDRALQQMTVSRVLDGEIVGSSSDQSPTTEPAATAILALDTSH